MNLMLDYKEPLILHTHLIAHQRQDIAVSQISMNIMIAILSINMVRGLDTVCLIETGIYQYTSVVTLLEVNNSFSISS